MTSHGDAGAGAEGKETGGEEPPGARVAGEGRDGGLRRHVRRRGLARGPDRPRRQRPARYPARVRFARWPSNRSARSCSGSRRVGLAALAIWKVCEAVAGHKEEDGGKLACARAASAGKAIVFVVLAVAAFQTVTDSSGGGSGEEGYTAKIMKLPFGPALVVALGLAIIGYGALQHLQGPVGQVAEEPGVRGQHRRHRQGRHHPGQDGLHQPRVRVRRHRRALRLGRLHPRRREVRRARPGAARSSGTPRSERRCWSRSRSGSPATASSTSRKRGTSRQRDRLRGTGRCWRRCRSSGPARCPACR